MKIFLFPGDFPRLRPHLKADKQGANAVLLLSVTAINLG